MLIDSVPLHVFRNSVSVSLLSNSASIAVIHYTTINRISTLLFFLAYREGYHAIASSGFLLSFYHYSAQLYTFRLATELVDLWIPSAVTLLQPFTQIQSIEMRRIWQYLGILCPHGLQDVEICILSPSLLCCRGV